MVESSLVERYNAKFSVFHNYEVTSIRRVSWSCVFMYWSRQLKILIQRNNSKTTKFCGSELFLVGCCVVLANGGCLRLMLYPSLYFFVAIFAPQTTGKSPHNAFRLGHISSPTPLPPPQPQLTFVWLLWLLTKRRPPKTCAPPFLNFLMCAIWAPQTRDPAAASPSPGAGRQRWKRWFGSGDG